MQTIENFGIIKPEGNMETSFDLIIIGAGPAGLTAAQYGARANLRTLLIEEASVGGQSLNITDLENYPGFENPISGAELCSRMKAQADKFGAKFLAASVQSISKQNDIFTITTDSGLFTAYTVILATGAKHRKLGAKGEDEFVGRGVSYCAACDGAFFKDKKIIVVGGGDTACSEALFLANLSDKIIMIHRKDRFRAQKALADRVLANKNIEVRFNTTCTEIKGTDKVESAVLMENGIQYEQDTDAVFIFTGILPVNQLAEGVNMDEAGYIITDSRMETSLKGLFAVGDVRTSPFRQVVTACSDGAVAAHYAGLLVDELKGEAYI